MPKKKLNFSKIKSIPHLLIFITGFTAGYSYIEFDKGQWLSVPQPSKQINVCFTPPAGCSSLIVNEIHHAKKSIFMQAFSFTSESIANELIAAHHRGITVKILFDRSQMGEKNSKFEFLKNAGLNVKIDHVSGLAHNKVLVIDEQKVLTGSYNFTNAAEKRNADNIIMINNSQLAKHYYNNWLERYNKSH